MSLDVYLSVSVDTGGTEPHTTQLFSANVTHNLNTMADAAGIYQALWRPEEIGVYLKAETARMMQEYLESMKMVMK